MHADRNLLFGILALQMDFITRDALIAAMSAWAVAKDQLLGQLLADQGALQAEHRALLEPLVEAHLKAHSGDPQKSLAALSSVNSVREDLSRVADPDVQASLAHVSTRRPEADPYPTKVDALPPPVPVRFRVLRPHAKGGLGEVFVARDEELHREVALKEIQNRHADDPASRARFVVEAEITGGLEHPGVVPVYGLGHYADGRPFYAMRFIRGNSLEQAIAQFHQADGPDRDPRERNLASRALLGRFVDVCQAIAYAHSRGVLHRDLKPGNVMLGRYGETLVVDWGLAKPLGQAASDTPEGPLTPASEVGSAPTEMGAAVGTPAYMSPEQALGRLDVLGPASDVYSLGATLYHLLSGRPPFADQDAGTVLLQVQAGDYPHLRQLKPQVPAALEAVCAKAMRLRPEDRYATPAALAQEVERWLADEAVAAYWEPWPARLGRWARRHRGLAAGTAAAVAVALASLAVGLLVVAGKNRALDAANTRLTEANTALDASNGQLTEANAKEAAARATAETRKQQADERFTLALRAFEQLVIGVQQKLENRSGTQDLRKALLATAVDGLARLARNAEQTRGTDRTTAWAYLTLGDIFLQIEGQTGQAQQEYQRGLDLFQRLLRDHPNDAQALRDLAFSYSKFGDVTLRLGRTADALKAYQDAGAFFQRRLADDPKDTEAQRYFAVSHGMLGDVYLQLGRTADALKAYQDAGAFFQRRAADDSRDARALRDLSVSHERLGKVYLQLGRTADALKAHRDGLAIRQRRADDDPKDAQAQRDLAVSHDMTGDVYLQLGRTADALKAYQDAGAIYQRRAAGDRKDAQALRDLALSYAKPADVYLQLGRTAEALAAYLNARAIFQQRATDDPHSFEAQVDLIVTYQKLGQAEQQALAFEAAAAWYGQGLAVLKALDQQGKLRGTTFAAWPPELEKDQAFCQAAVRAVASLDFALRQPKAQVPGLLSARAAVLARRGQHADAAATAEKLAAHSPIAAPNVYNAACGLAQCAAAAGRSPEPDLALVERYAARAVALLGQAQSAGFFKDPAKIELLKTDKDLEPLRARADFQKLADAVAKAGKK
jgi:tetratricopeptide (TPR) repeat protein/tRNA A-37 threonylcarbamoyl transferase component Bud32